MKLLLRRHRICIHLINHSFNPHPHGKIGENVDDAALIGERRLLEHGHILHQSIMYDVFHNLIHEINLSAVQLRVIQVWQTAHLHSRWL